MQRATTLAASTREGEKKCAEGLRPVHRLSHQTAVAASSSSKRASLSPTKKSFKSEGSVKKVKGKSTVVRVKEKKERVVPDGARRSQRIAAKR